MFKKERHSVSVLLIMVFAEINFNNQGESVNKFNAETLAELRKAVDTLKAQSDIRGLLLTSAKSVFVVGADITEL